MPLGVLRYYELAQQQPALCMSLRYPPPSALDVCKGANDSLFSAPPQSETEVHLLTLKLCFEVL